MNDYDYVPRDHWESLHARDDLSAVGHPGLPAEFNAAMYRNSARNLDRFLATNLRDRPETVYDVGAGTGYWVEYWLKRRAKRVDGGDLAEAAVRRLSRRFPGDFTVLDISVESPTGRYELVSCMSVLLHIKDEAAFEQALRHLAEAVAPGGALLLADSVASREWEKITSRVRPMSRYTTHLAAAGLQLRATAGATVIGANPIERAARLYPVWRSWWMVASRLSWHSRVAGPLGRFIYAVDPILLKLGFEPSAKFALFERPR